MKYFIFVASLACVTAAPSITELEQYGKDTHIKINELAQSISALIPNLVVHIAVLTLQKELSSIDRTIKDYIKNIPQDQSLQIFRHKLSEGLLGYSVAIFAYWDWDLTPVQNGINRVIQSARILLNVPASTAAIYIPDASPEDQETMFNLAKEAIDIAHQKVKDLLKALQDLGGSPSGTQK